MYTVIQAVNLRGDTHFCDIVYFSCLLIHKICSNLK